jgi:DNA invertase Pin-like site-specific DNA recombinase
MKIGYARVSTEEQNLGLQIDALSAAGCDRIYKDEGISAAAPERPAFRKALATLKPGDTLIIWKIDRAFRSLLHALNVLEDLDSRGVSFHSLTEAIDTTTPMGRFAYQITGAFAELERALIIERTKAGMEAARRRGKQIGRPPKMTREQIEFARDMMADGKSLREIAALLDVEKSTLQKTLKRERERLTK